MQTLPSTRVDLSARRGHGSTLVRWGTSTRYTLDGLLYRHGPYGDQAPQGNYALIFKNGIVEAVEADDVDPTDSKPLRFSGFGYDRLLAGNLRRLLSVQQSLGVEPPIFVALTLMGVKGWSVWVDTFRYPVDEAHPIDRGLLPLTPTIIEDFRTPPEVLMKDTLDELWQASGWSRSLSHDENGCWAPRER